MRGRENPGTAPRDTDLDHTRFRQDHLWRRRIEPVTRYVYGWPRLPRDLDCEAFADSWDVR